MNTLGSEIYSDIESNEYLQEIYENILLNYSYNLFRIATYATKQVDLDHALRFADLLSKSSGSPNSENHRIWGQVIVALLAKLYPQNDTVKCYLGSVLSSVSNYRGLEMQQDIPRLPVVLDEIFSNFEKELLRIPAQPDAFFFRTQKNVYDSLTQQYFSYSGPTSMGKSFVMRMFIKERITKGYAENYVIIVPTKALINEVSTKIIDDLKTLLPQHNYRVVTSGGALSLQQDHNFVLVLTPERLLYLLLERPTFKIDYLFIDEAHKISSKDSRSPFYYKVIDLLSKRESKPHIIFSSPNIPNPEVYLQLIPGVSNAAENKLATTYSPVNQIKYVVDLVDSKVCVFNDYRRTAVEVGTFKQPVMPAQLIRVVGAGHQNIIYCSSTKKAVDMALDYAKTLPVLSSNTALMSLAKEIRNEIHNDYYLADVISKGVAYHIGYLPSNIRLQIESLFRSGDITAIFCTSTLVEGVNLPADNLFITHYKNGLSNMTPVDFKNLIGRVGRIEFNLYGNVFLVRADQNVNSEKYVELLETDVPAQKLSVVSQLTGPQKRKVVECLSAGNIELLKYPKTQSVDSYALMRKFAIMLLRDILTNNKDSVVRKEFASVMSAQDEESILKSFQDKRNMDDDINVSVDQIDNLSAEIAKGLSYPLFNAQGNIDYNELVEFLEKLCRIFKWDAYEAATLGHVSKKTGNHGKLRWYAVILSQWIRGNGLGIIMNDAIAYKKDHPESGVEVNGAYVDYDGSIAHKNIVISDTLNAIEDVVLFRISNYFLRFSAEYKRQHGLTAMQNDWYEYVEYGTTNPLTIMLQRNGFTRETATYLKQHREFLIEISGETKISTTILGSAKASVVKEIREVMYNIPDLFVNTQ